MNDTSGVLPWQTAFGVSELVLIVCPSDAKATSNQQPVTSNQQPVTSNKTEYIRIFEGFTPQYLKVKFTGEKIKKGAVARVLVEKVNPDYMEGRLAE